VKLPKSLTTVTLFSKTLAGTIFIALVLTAFFVGMKYQAMTDFIKIQQSNPIATKPSPAPDLTANWQTHSDNIKKFSVRYPSSLKLVERKFSYGYFTDFTDMALNEDGTTAKKDILYYHEGGIAGNGFELIEKGFRLTIYIDQGKVTDTKREMFRTDALARKITVDGQEAYEEIINEEIAGFKGTSIGVTVFKGSNIYRISSNTFPATRQEYVLLFDKILSTFKFTDSSSRANSIPAPEGNQTACTMEAKLCPDGKTYVSRTGPNCQFAPCS
jgi:hypothetical protein